MTQTVNSKISVNINNYKIEFYIFLRTQKKFTFVCHIDQNTWK